MLNKNKFLNFFCWIAMKWWCFWSGIRFRKMDRFSKDINEEDKVSTIDDIQNVINKINSKFEYTKDDITMLFDAILPPRESYKRYTEGKLKEDCDGFHSAVYHVLQSCNIESYLMAVNAKGFGHCVLVFNLDKMWHVLDYTTIHDGYLNLETSIFTYNKQVPIHYGIKNEVFYNALISYNYEKGKFKYESLKKKI